MKYVILIYLFCIISINSTFFAQDEPCSASSLTVNTTCTYTVSNNTSATSSLGVPAPGCAGYLNNDVWFSIIVPASGGVVVDSQAGTINDGGMAIYGGTCSVLTLILCDDDSSPNGAMPLITASGLTPGSTIWIRFWKYNGGTGTFSICATAIPSPPINDNCSGAISVTPSVTCNPIIGNLGGATQSLAGCTGVANDDVWFSFTATQASLNISLTPGANCDPVVEVFSGSCASLTSVICNNTSFPYGATGTINVPTLTVGQNYYYRVYDNNTAAVPPSSYSFSTCVVLPPPPPLNDNCDEAITLTVNNSCVPINGTYNGSTQSMTAGCGGASVASDVWYSFVATQVYQNISLTFPIAIGNYLELFTGSCGNLTSISCQNIASSSNSTTTLDELTPGQIYYFRLYPSSNQYPTSTFTICLTNTLPPNAQDCLGAIPICTNEYSTTTAYSGIGNIGNEINGAISCFASGEKNDVWYTFTVISSGNLNFTITPNVLSEDYDWAVFNLTNGNCWDINNNEALQVACNYSWTSGATGPNGLSGSQNGPVIPVLVGQTYVINVSQYTTSTNGYSINFGASTASIFDNVAPVLQSISSPSCGHTEVSVTFSENMLCNTVTTSNFTLTGPDGIHSITGISSVGCDIGGTMENTYSLSFSPPLTVAGTYTVSLVNASGSVTDLCGNVATPESLIFTITAPITIASTIQNVQCNGGNSGSTTCSVVGGTSPYTYSWTQVLGTNNNSQSYSNLTAGTYTVTVTDSNGCISTSSTIVTEPPVLTTTLSSIDPTCSSLGSISANVSGGTVPYFYLWSPTGGSSANTTNLSEGTYTLQVTDSNGCVNSNISILTNSSSMTSGIQSLTPQCLLGNNFIFDITSSTSTGSSVVYDWNYGDGTTNGIGTNSSHSYTNAGNYTVTLTVSNGICISTATQLIIVNTMPIAIATTNTPCEGQSLNFSGLPNGMASYNWVGPTNFTLQNPLISNASMTNSGNYSLSVTDLNGCTNTALLTVSVNPSPQANINLQNSLGCSPLLTNFSFDNPSINSFNWNFGDGSYDNTTSSPIHNYSEAGNFDVNLTITDDNGCSTIISETNAVTVYQNPMASFSYLSNGENSFSSDVNFIDQSSNDVISWYWNFGDGSSIDTTNQNPTHIYLANDSSYNVTLIVQNDHNCMDSISNIIKISEPLIYYVPNVFTPNGDANNQIFHPVFTSGFDIYNFSLFIFNRWGEIVFESHDASVGWDGTYNDKKVSDGVYIWTIEFGAKKDDKRYQEVGSLTLIR